MAEREVGAQGEFEPNVVVNDRLEDAIEDLTRLVSTIWAPRRRGAPK